MEQVWTRILGTAEVAGRWDEAGGDSLKLLRCVMDLEELIGEELNMEALTVDMSAADMIRAAAMGGRSGRQQHDEELLPHLVILPGSMGYGPSMAAFGAQLSKVAHVTPIRYPDLTSALTGRGSSDDMAAMALEQINAVQPRGDIRLIGYLLGGGVAFEVASRLIAEGRSVKFLGILDTNIVNRQAKGTPRIGVQKGPLYLRSRMPSARPSGAVSCAAGRARVIAKCVVRLRWEVEFCRIIDARTWTHLAATRFMLRLELEEILRMRGHSAVGWRIPNTASRSLERYSFVIGAGCRRILAGVLCLRS